MLAIVGFLSTQTRTAKLVLIESLAGVEATALLKPVSRAVSRTINKSGTGPHAAPAGTRRANVVVHFPARAERVTFIGSADCIADFTSYYVTKIGETVQRFECADFAAETLCRFV